MLGAFDFMQIKFIAEIIADIPVVPEDVCNFDTVGEYNTGLSCEVVNSALNYLTTYLDDAADIKILSAEPDEEGIDEYNEHLNNYQGEYTKRMRKYERA